MVPDLLKRVETIELAPKIPYRKHTDDERKKFIDFSEDLSPENSDRFWQQTEEEANEIIRRIEGEGFVVGERHEFTSHTGYGDLKTVFPRNYQGDVKSFYGNSIIGIVHLWRGYGFDSDPTCIVYRHSSVLDDALELRRYLLDSGAPFYDAVDVPQLKYELSELEKERDEKSEILGKLEGIELIR